MKSIFLFLFLFISSFGFAQNQSNIRVDGLVYVPKTQAQRLAIVNPKQGFTVFQSDGVSGFYFYKGSAWYLLGGDASALQSTVDAKADLTYTNTQLALKANQSSISNINNISDLNKPISTATQTALNAKLSITGGNITGLVNFSKNAPVFSEYKRTDSGNYGRASVGQLGVLEANLSWNMDYTTGIHKHYDTSLESMWLALSGGNFAIQVAPPSSNTGDVWDNSGNKYALWGTADGHMAINTNLSDDKGTGQFFIKRAGGNASIGGYGDLVLEGDRRVGAVAPVYINTYNSGDVYVATGGGKVGLGGFAPNEKLTVISQDAELFGIYRDFDATSSTAGGYFYMGAKLGSTLTQSASLISFLEAGGSSGNLNIQTRTAGALTTKMRIEANGNVGFGTTTPTSKLQVVGLPTYADNSTATAGGLTVGAFYRTSTGVLMVVF